MLRLNRESSSLFSVGPVERIMPHCTAHAAQPRGERESNQHCDDLACAVVWVLTVSASRGFEKKALQGTAAC
jgi:hypothetical protein